ncbi:MAG TPA: ABC transporter permease [Stellaceae bacterium]|nr:ABC transporter permease [Stellaceae bacterium]
MAEFQASLPRAARGQFGPVLSLRIGTVLLLWALWEGAARSGLFYEGALPSSFKIARAALNLVVMPAFYYNFGVTLLEVAAAVAIGVTCGISVGLALGASRFAGKAFEPYLQYLAPTPKIIFLPVFMVMFGVGGGSKIAIGALSCFFPMALSVTSGVRQVDPVLLRVGRSFQLTLAQTIRKIYLPALLPPIATGLRLGLGVAIIGTLLGEIKMSNRGLGFLIMQDYGRFDIAEMYAVLAVVFVLAALVNGVIARTLRMKGRGS